MLKISFKFCIEDLSLFNTYLKHFINQIDLHIIDRLNIQNLVFEIDKIVYYKQPIKKHIRKSIDLNTISSLSNFFEITKPTPQNNYFAHSIFCLIFEAYFKRIDYLQNEYNRLNKGSSNAAISQ